MKFRSTIAVTLMALCVLGTAACDEDEDFDDEDVFVATLRGNQEVPPVTTNATGEAQVIFTETGLTFEIDVNNISNVILAHIHGPAPVGTNAQIVLNLLTAPSNVTNGRLVTGSRVGAGTDLAAVSMESLKTMIRNGQAYVNVHTTQNQGGEIRGQLRRP